MKNKKSAKDIAFDKERAKYRKQIRELEATIVHQLAQISDFNKMINDRDDKIRELQDWIERLLEYTELSEEEMQKIIQKDKDAVDAAERLKDMEKLLLRFSLFGGM